MSRRTNNYPRELRERAVRMVSEATPEYPSPWAAMTAVAQKLGIGSTETLRKMGTPGRDRRWSAAGVDERGARFSPPHRVSSPGQKRVTQTRLAP